MRKRVFFVALLILPVAIALAYPSTWAKAAAQEGQELFVKFCASCHGQTGKGDGPLGAMLNPKPQDLTKKNEAANKDFYFKIIKEGGAAVGKAPIMPPWGKSLKDDQINKIIAFIESLQK